MQTEPTAAGAQQLLDICGRRRSPATFREFHQGRKPGNAGQTYPADPPTITEIVAVMKACDQELLTGQRLRAPRADEDAGRALR
jgi:hypothetical protein